MGEGQEPKQLGELMKIVMLTPTQMLSLTSDDGTYSLTKKNLLKK